MYKLQVTMQNRRFSDLHKYGVFLSAFLCLVLPISYSHSFGRLYVAVIERFHSSRAEAAVIQSTTSGVFLAIGILTGSVVQKFGTRTAGLVGSLVTSLSIAVSFFASSVKFLIVTHGICLGIGTSLIFISSSTAVGQMFEGKSKLLALSVLSCGSGVGGMVYPYLLDKLLEDYGLPGTFLIVSGILGNTIALSLMWTNDIDSGRDKRIGGERGKPSTDHGKLSIIDTVKDINSNNSGFESTQSVTEGVGKPTNSRGKSSTIGAIKDYNSNNSGKEIVQSASGDVHVTDTVSAKDTGTQIRGDRKRRQSIWIIERVYSQFNPNSKMNDKSVQTRSKLTQSLRHVLAVKSFVFCTIGLLVANPAINMFRVLFVDTMQDAGLSNTDISLGLLLLNICSTLGRLAVGGLQQSSNVSPLFAPILATLLGTGGMALMTIADTFFLVMLVCCINGAAQGMIYASFTVTSARLVGTEHLPTAVGLTLTLNAVGNTIAAPISGFIRDTLGSYRTVFTSASVSMATGSVILICAQLLKEGTRRSKSRRVSIYVTKL